MHDLHAADQILNLTLDKAIENKLLKVTKIVVELGEVVEHSEEINPENLKFNLKLLAKPTIARDAEVVIKRVKGSFWRLKEIEGE